MNFIKFMFPPCYGKTGGERIEETQCPFNCRTGGDYPEDGLLRFSDRIAVALSEAKHNKHMLAVTLIDLYRFKQTNDTWGYEMGDKG